MHHFMHIPKDCVLVCALVLTGFGCSTVDAVRRSDEGLVGCWAFDEGRGEVAGDASGNANDGRIQHCKWVTQDFGTALHFDGENSYVAIPALPALDGSDELTIEVWVFWEGVGRYPNILTGGAWNPGGFLLFVCDEQCMFRMGKPGKEPWELRKTWQETGALVLRPIELGRWYHLATTFKRPDITTYVNGEPVACGRWNFPVGQTGKIHLGKWDLDESERPSHYGLIDELRIYKRALGADEIKAGYEMTRTGRIHP